MWECTELCKRQTWDQCFSIFLDEGPVFKISNLSWTDISEKYNKSERNGILIFQENIKYLIEKWNKGIPSTSPKFLLLDVIDTKLLCETVI